MVKYFDVLAVDMLSSLSHSVGTLFCQRAAIVDLIANARMVLKLGHIIQGYDLGHCDLTNILA
jgi:hypothetical protein